HVTPVLLLSYPPLPYPIHPPSPPTLSLHDALPIYPDKDVSILAVGSAQNRTAALLAGSIQGGVSQPPDSIALEAKGFHVLYDLASQKLPSANTSVAVRRSYIASSKDVVQRYVDSLVQGTKKLKADKAFGVSVLKKYFASTDEAAMSVT